MLFAVVCAHVCCGALYCFACVVCVCAHVCECASCECFHMSVYMCVNACHDVCVCRPIYPLTFSIFDMKENQILKCIKKLNSKETENYFCAAVSHGTSPAASK